MKPIGGESRALGQIQSGDGHLAIQCLADERVDVGDGGCVSGLLSYFIRRGDCEVAVLQGPDGRDEVQQPGDIEDMFDDDEGEAVVGGEGAKVGENIVDAVGIEAGERFVQEEDAGIGLEGAGDGDALGLSEGDPVGRGCVAPGEAKGSETDGGGAALGGGAGTGAARTEEGGPRRIAAARGSGGDVVGEIEGFEEADVLPGAAHPESGDGFRGEALEGIDVAVPGAGKREDRGSWMVDRGWKISDLVALARAHDTHRWSGGKVGNGAGVGFEAAGEDVEEGGFAAAILAAKEDDLAGADLRRDSIEHDPATEGFAEVAEAQYPLHKVTGGGLAVGAGDVGLDDQGFGFARENLGAFD